MPTSSPNTNAGRSVVRAEEVPAVAAFRVKMATQEAKQIYRQRGAVAEFPNAWIKTKIGLGQFRLRGLAKVTMETNVGLSDLPSSFRCSMLLRVTFTLNERSSA
jgi:hypothetical protein